MGGGKEREDRVFLGFVRLNTAPQHLRGRGRGFFNTWGKGFISQKALTVPAPPPSAGAAVCAFGANVFITTRRAFEYFPCLFGARLTGPLCAAIPFMRGVYGSRGFAAASPRLRRCGFAAACGFAADSLQRKRGRTSNKTQSFAQKYSVFFVFFVFLFPFLFLVFFCLSSHSFFSIKKQTKIFIYI